MTSHKLKLLPIALAVLILETGCVSAGADYQRPKLDVKSVSTAPESKTDLLTWWKSYQDPVLDAHLAEALANNQDLVIATARIDEARAAANISRSDRYPTVDGTLGASKNRTSLNSGTLPPGTANIRKNYQVGLNAAYEIDLWGKMSRADEAARARLLAQEANRGTVQTSLVATVAESYFALRAFDAQLELALATQKTRQDNLRLQQKRYAAGAIGELDLHLAESEAAAADIIVAQAKQSVDITESAIAVVLGRSPLQVSNPTIARGLSMDALYAKRISPDNLPADLLNRRPDILSAEQALIAANADVGQARAAYFPSIRLTGSYGYQSTALSELSDPTSMLWNLGVNLTQPIFRAGAIGAVVAGAEARKTQAKAQYVQAVQNSFRDVHDVLTNMEAAKQISEAANKRVIALKNSVRLATLRYESGYTSYQDLLNAQRDLQQTQSTLIDAQRAHLASFVGMYKAVGGGWDRPDSLAER
jgi:outer membrane protein, multidrug efflux system